MMDAIGKSGIPRQSLIAGTRGIKAGNRFKDLSSFREFAFGRILLPQVQSLFKDRYGIEVAEIFADLPAKAAILAMANPTFMEAITEKGDFSHTRFDDFTIAIENRDKPNNINIFFLRDKDNKKVAESRVPALGTGSVAALPVILLRANTIKPILSVVMKDDDKDNESMLVGNIDVFIENPISRRLIREKIATGSRLLFICEKADIGLWLICSNARPFGPPDLSPVFIGEWDKGILPLTGNRRMNYYTSPLTNDSVIYSSLSPNRRFFADTGLSYDFAIIYASQKRPIFIQEKEDDVYSVSIAWSESGEYIAITDSEDRLRIYRFSEIMEAAGQAEEPVSPSAML